MKKIFASLIILSIGLCVFDLQAKADEPSSKRPLPLVDAYSSQKPEIEAVADNLEYVRDQKKIIARGNVVLRYENTQLTSDYAEVYTDTRKAYAKGHVLVFQNEVATAQGEEIHYDFENKQGTFPQGKYVNPPWYSSGDDIRQVKEGHREVTKGCVTTCASESPQYTLHAKKITIYDKDKMIARNVVIRIAGKPVFWWPYLIIPLQSQSVPFAISAGHNSRYGYYIEVTKGFGINENIWGKMHFDWRSKRGFGSGVDFGYDYGPLAKGDIKLYWTQDKEAPTPGAVNPFKDLEERDRGRILWRHRTDITPDHHVILRYSRLADEYFLQDFFQKEDRSEVEPDSFITWTYNTDYYGIFVNNQKKMNPFERVVERLPQVRFDWKNRQVGHPNLYHVGQLSFDNLNKRYGRADKNEDVVRMHAAEEWLAPLKWNDLKITPSVNFAGTYYSREKESDNDRFRAAIGAGLDIRKHYYRIYDVDTEFAGIEIHQLRHVVEPLIKWKAVSSSVSDETLSHFDSVDLVDDEQSVTVGVENRIQTKRFINGRMQRVDLVSMNTYLSYELYPDGKSRVSQFEEFIDGRTSSNLTILSEELVLRPYNWLQFESKFDYDMEKGHFRVFNNDLNIKTTDDRLRFVFGHRFVRDFEDVFGSHQFVFDTRYRLNRLWETGGYIRWDVEDDGLEEWQVSFKRYMACQFVLEFGYNVRESSVRSSNKTLFFEFYLQPFHQYGLRSGSNRASFAEPRIGETVNGASQYGGRSLSFDTFSSSPVTS